MVRGVAGGSPCARLQGAARLPGEAVTSWLWERERETEKLSSPKTAVLPRQGDCRGEATGHTEQLVYTHTHRRNKRYERHPACACLHTTLSWM